MRASRSRSAVCNPPLMPLGGIWTEVTFAAGTKDSVLYLRVDSGCYPVLNKANKKIVLDNVPSFWNLEVRKPPLSPRYIKAREKKCD